VTEEPRTARKALWVTTSVALSAAIVGGILWDVHSNAHAILLHIVIALFVTGLGCLVLVPAVLVPIAGVQSYLQTRRQRRS
jgi:hypothetical protein